MPPAATTAGYRTGMANLATVVKWVPSLVASTPGR